jgi:hypothetical protein
MMVMMAGQGRDPVHGFTVAGFGGIVNGNLTFNQG